MSEMGEEGRRQLVMALSGTIEQMNLRKWCIEQALTVMSGAEAINPEAMSPVTFAQSIYDFITKPALDAALEEK